MTAFSRSQFSLLLGGSLLFAAVVDAPARADLSVCNKSNQDVATAIAFRAERMWASNGWWVIGPNQCETLIEGPLADGPYYIHAIEHLVGGTWEGVNKFCVDQASFSITGRLECSARGFSDAGFFELKTAGATDWQHELLPRPKASSEPEASAE